MFDVVVLGGGVIGLTTARRFQQQGAQVCVVTSRPVEATTSHLAAAVWYPTGVDADPEVLRWAGRTFEVFARQAVEGTPGVRMCPTRMLQRKEATVPWWASVVPGFRVAVADAPFVSAWEFSVPFVEMPTYLEWLRSQVLSAGGTVFSGRASDFEELAQWAPVVVNASGLAARRLCGDDAVRPARGQVVRVSNPGLSLSVRDEDNPLGKTYIHPRSRDVVLGGTYELDRWDTEVDPVTARDIRARAVELVPELGGSTLLGDHVGLRPTRTGGVRLEEDMAGPENCTLIHNYGHAGAGMTLSWGCAEEVVTRATSTEGSRLNVI